MRLRSDGTRAGRIRLIAAIIALASTTGCAEYGHVRTTPPGAKVELDGSFVGITPTLVRVPRSELGDPPHYRLELDGYRPEEGQLQTGIGAGRIVGMVFTLGIVGIFKDARYIKPVNVDLDRNEVVGGQSLGQKPSGAPADTEARLRRLSELYQRGLITEDEYRRYREETVRGF